MLGDFTLVILGCQVWRIFRSATAQDHEYDSQVGVLGNMLVVGFWQLGLLYNSHSILIIHRSTMIPQQVMSPGRALVIHGAEC